MDKGDEVGSLSGNMNLDGVSSNKQTYQNSVVFQNNDNGPRLHNYQIMAGKGIYDMSIHLETSALLPLTLP